MFTYRTVIGLLAFIKDIHCYQPPNSEPTGLLVPNLWGVPNYMKNWVDVSRAAGQSAPLVGEQQQQQQLVNNAGEVVEERFLDKRQEPQQQQQQQQQQNTYNMIGPGGPGGMVAFTGESTYLDADAATVAAMQYELQSLVQTKYQAEAAIKMETGEISRTQHEAQEAERALEEATNNVRMISAHLKNAQEEASKAATRALTAQLQMSVHDQLLVTARQKLNSVTAHMIALQADLASAQQRFMLNNSTKELETRAHALHLRPDSANLVASLQQNGEPPLFVGNYPGQQHNSPAILSPGEFWHQQLDGNNPPPQQQQQPPANQQVQPQMAAPANWSPFSQIAPQDLSKSSNPAAAPLFLNVKKM